MSQFKTAPARAAPGSLRNEFIQILRFVAASLVAVTHTTFYYKERIDPSMQIWHGEIGVPIFFVISGVVMVISSAKLGANPAGARKFMVQRLFRIVPLYWLVTFLKIGAALAVPSVVLHNHFETLFAVKSLLFIPTYNAAGELAPIHGVGWTLLHEMFFYVVFAAMMLLRLRPAWFASLCILALYGLGLAAPPQSAFMVVATHPVNLNFIVGMLIGMAILERRSAGWSRGPAALGVALLLFGVVKLAAPDALSAVDLDPVVVLLGFLMLVFAFWKVPAALGVPVALGNSSYALYLFHPLLIPPLLVMMHRVTTGLGAWPQVLLTAVLFVGLAHVIYLLIETPLNRGVRQLFSHRTATARSVKEAA